jgi:hypothetical protein
VGRDEQVVDHQVRRPGGVAGDPGGLSSRHEDIFRPCLPEKAIDGGAVDEIGLLGMRGRGEALRRQPGPERPADHRAAARHVDARPGIHADQAVVYIRSIRCDVMSRM